ncbi:hypothetical protein BDZ45DRAFT_749921 [Acephala macrosclerotiorum]|nr:hypothetical protein BDZ45DRAFT_749921 [Acephala macrosclerotiorum]
MRMPDHDLFEKTLYDISTPDHQDYWRHLNHEEVRTLVNPEVAATEAVLSCLSNSGISDSDVEDNTKWVRIRYFLVPFST